MNNFLSILFAIVDSKVWNISRVVAWADQLIAKLDSPKTWLLDLSISDSIDSCLEVIREAMRESGVSLPGDFGELMAGFILIRFDNGELSEETARSYLVDVVDAYGTNSIDAEAVATLSLNSSVYSAFRQNAEQVLIYVSKGQFLETEQNLVNG